jgi:hypothetical protein
MNPSESPSRGLPHGGQRDQTLSQIAFAAWTAHPGFVKVPHQRLCQQFPHRLIFPEAHFTDFLANALYHLQRGFDGLLAL